MVHIADEITGGCGIGLAEQPVSKPSPEFSQVSKARLQSPLRCAGCAGLAGQRRGRSGRGLAES